MLLLMEEIFTIIQLKVILNRELKKIMIGKGEDYTTRSFLDYNNFDKHYKLVAVDLSKEQFNKLNLSICLEQIQLFTGYSKNLKKLY